MTLIISYLKLLSTKNFFTKMPSYKVKTINFYEFKRNYADKPKTDSKSKQIMVQGTEDEPRMRVRRARPADVPRILRFVRENSRLAWPGLVNKTPGSNSYNVVLSDYIARTLAQGHSMLAEQQEAKRGWSQIRGLAISTSVCPWDATMLEKWARCMRCSRSRKLMLFTAHCLRAPALHEKYSAHNILQVILMVPPDVPRASEIIHMLAKNSIQRGRDSGFPVLRFDVADNKLIAKVLDELRLKKEYELNFEVLPNAIKLASNGTPNSEETVENKEKTIQVYTAFPKTGKT
ncbi:uncharacterized protein LOC125077811 [Vanessa atalanta]|uniref:uncharacterized protein LOC125077811 n=1 Tax=Vanessa atalanta TaxID=42275 RepID=UPI001FCDEE66|nr:uncharacterized protein LOC125077811 [Vanessa atalanta]